MPGLELTTAPPGASAADVGQLPFANVRHWGFSDWCAQLLHMACVGHLASSVISCAFQHGVHAACLERPPCAASAGAAAAATAARHGLLCLQRPSAVAAAARCHQRR